MADELLVCLFLMCGALVTIGAADACVDILYNCRSYGQQTCVDYADWSKINCAYTCQFCTGPSPQRECADLIHNCKDYVDDLCTNDAYRIWAEDYCSSYCGFCGTPHTVPTAQTPQPPTPSAATPCDDLINFCSVYSQLACNDTTWADVYCSKYCNRC